MDKVPASLINTVVGYITNEYRDFHSPLTLPKGSENWRNTKVKRLYPHEVKIDAAFRTRATKHVRDMIKFEQMMPEIEAYLQRKSDKAA
jgi:hypothetical protein